MVNQLQYKHMQPNIKSPKQGITTLPANTISVSTSCATIYEQLINQWLFNMSSYNHLSAQTFPWPLSDRYFKQVFLVRVRSRFGINIIFDNLMTTSLLKKLQSNQFIRFSSSEPNLDLHLNRKIVLKTGQRWLLIYMISQILYRNGFISKNRHKDIINKCSSNNSIQKRLSAFCLYTVERAEKNKSKKYVISLKIWNQLIGINCRQFWNNYIFEWKQLICRYKQKENLYNIFKNYLQQRLTRIQIQQIKKALDIRQTILIEEKNQNLETIAQKLNVFSNEQIVRKINHQINAIMRFVQQKIINKYKQITKFKYQIYGSFRSKICLHNSDVDITIFLSNEQGNIQQSRQFIQKYLRKVYYILKNDYQSQNTTNIEKILAVINSNVKVPFIRVSFQSKMVLKSMDIVLNNIAGVQNSMMLQIFAKNKIIRDIGIILKKWGKNSQLISMSRLSSYGVTIMLLYYFMKKGYLNYLNENAYENLNIDYSFIKRPEDYLCILEEFFSFFQFVGQFQQKVICLYRSCQNHESLINKKLAINIHDPILKLNLNIGRLKSYDKFKFINQVSNAKEQITKIKKLEPNQQKQQIMKFLKMNQYSQEIIQIN